MATMLMQRAEMVTSEKALLSQTVRSCFDGEGRIEMNPKEEGGVTPRGSEGGRFRSKKGKNGQKKQPQRGLGVAQLEKIRLQEQSKQEAACLASLQYLRGVSSFSPSVTLGDYSSDVMRLPSPLVQHFRAGLCHALNSEDDGKAFGALPEPHSAGYAFNIMASNAKARVYEALMPFAADPSNPVPYIRPGHGSSLSILIPRKTSYDPPLSCSSNAKEFSCSDDKSDIINTQRKKSEIDCMQLELETDSLSQINGPPLNAIRIRKAASHATEVKDTEIDKARFSSHYLSKSLEGPPLTLGFVDSCKEPPDLHHKKPDSLGHDMPAALGIPIIGQRSKELSSFQNYAANDSNWCYEDKSSTLKRKWLSLQENPSLFSMIFESDTAIGDSNNQPSTVVYAKMQTSETVNAGAHYTTGSVRDALGSSRWSPSNIKYDMVASDRLEALNRFHTLENGWTSISIGSRSSPFEVLEHHAKDCDSSKSSFTTQFLGEDGTACNTKPSSGDFLALRLSNPSSVNIKHAEADSHGNGRVEIELQDLKHDAAALQRNSTADTDGGYALTTTSFCKEPTKQINGCSKNLLADEKLPLSAPSSSFQSRWYSPSEGPHYPQTTPLSCGDIRSSLIGIPALNCQRSIDLSLKLAL